MTAKEVITDALRLVGSDDAADAITSGEALGDEVARLKKAFITYLNAVLDELARGYFPLTNVEEMSAEDGRYAFALFAKHPVRINRVRGKKGAVGWHVCPDYLVADSPEITVSYDYAPERLSEDDEFYYPRYEVSERLAIYGCAAEHFLVLGDSSAAQLWESRYRAETELIASREKLSGRIPSRRWV